MGWWESLLRGLGVRPGEPPREAPADDESGGGALASPDAPPAHAADGRPAPVGVQGQEAGSAPPPTLESAPAEPEEGPPSETPSEDATPPEPVREVAREPALEAAIATDRLNPAPYLAYAEWLRAEGDPRAALIEVQHRLMSPPDLTTLRELREQEAGLLRDHGAHLAGPAYDFEHRFHLGFVRHVELDGFGKGAAGLASALEVEHPATAFLASVKVPARDAAVVRAALERSGRDGARVITDTYDEVFDADTIGWAVGRLLAEITAEGVELSMRIDGFGAGMSSHSYAVRAVAEGGGHRHAWWYGSGEALTEEPLGDDPVFSGRGVLPPFEGAGRFSIELRLQIRGESGTETLWLEGSGEVQVEVQAGGEAEVLLRRCAPKTGAPFEIPAPTRVSAPTGPVLLAPREGSTTGGGNPSDAALPGRGVFVAPSRLLTEAGASRELELPPPPGDVWGSAAWGGPRGALVRGKQERHSSRCWLTFCRVPDGTARHLALEGRGGEGAFDARGERFALIDDGHLCVFDVDEARALRRAALPALALEGEDAAGEQIVWSEGAPHAIRPGQCARLDLETGELHVTATPPSPVRPGWRQYGASEPSYHPAAGRLATMLCAEFPSEAAPEGLTIVAWSDADGSRGQVAIPDHGWAHEDSSRFVGTVVVLACGRMLALGRRVWLVDAASGEVSDLGPAGAYSSLPTVTVDDSGTRLWSRGVGPWWIEIPAPRERPAPLTGP